MLQIDDGGVYIDKKSYEYFNALRLASDNAPFSDRNRVLIDITGHSPGVSLALGSRPIGKAWLLGGREFSDITVENSIAYAGEIPEDIWVLEAPGGRRAVSHTVLQNNGIPFPEEYTVALEIVHPCRKVSDGMGGECLVETHRLWRPSQPVK